MTCVLAGAPMYLPLPVSAVPALVAPWVGRRMRPHVTGRPPTLFRPPYGVMTTAAHLACRRPDLTPALWTCWGEDWRKRATPRSVEDTVLRDLRGGGTILLHDSDCTSATGSWRTTLRALPRILDTCQARGWQVGPLPQMPT
ncbi:hypothetical protein ACWERW_15745 [Streptomyces sp. NPDC004012]